jgi:WD40 repeat protein
MGLVSSIEPHVSRRTAFKNLLLTSSLDWTVKLWNLGSFGKPLFEFNMPSYDYVCDVKWSPANPGIFSTVASGGKIAIWKIGASTTGPFDEINVLDADTNKTTKDKKLLAAQKDKKSGALNKAVWAKDGLSILAGDSVGRVHFVAVNKSQVESSTEEDKRFEALLAQKEKEMSKK